MASVEIAEMIKKVRQIEIKTKYLVENLFQSAYASVFKGRGIEFSEVREYEYGDDVRTIDWKVSARMGKLYVKQFVEERDLTIYLLLDISGSHEWGTAGALKREVMVELCASIAYTAFKNNDRIGLLLFADGVEGFIPPRKGRAQVYKIIRESIFAEPKDKRTNLLPAIEYLLKVLRDRAVIFIVSDFQGESFLESSNLLTKLSKKNDVIAVKINDPMDFKIPAVGLVQLVDPETGEKMLVDTSDRKLRERYEKLSIEADVRVKKMLKIGNIDLIEISTAEDYVKPLLRFFMARERRKRRIAA
jgi:uncharacterized protein (DUF58 family)